MCSQIKEAAPPFAVSKRVREVKKKGGAFGQWAEVVGEGVVRGRMSASCLLHNWTIKKI